MSWIGGIAGATTAVVAAEVEKQEKMSLEELKKRRKMIYLITIPLLILGFISFSVVLVLTFL
ncbi:MAG: hypothetical protein FK734_02630 [Asgard group archaeon]|nr:hypothetical protein [Asgard group archaeon]